AVVQRGRFRSSRVAHNDIRVGAVHVEVDDPPGRIVEGEDRVKVAGLLDRKGDIGQWALGQEGVALEGGAGAHAMVFTRVKYCCQYYPGKLFFVGRDGVQVVEQAHAVAEGETALHRLLDVS